MLDTAFPSFQRIKGAARISFGSDNGLGQLYQQGSAKIMLPRCHGPVPEAVFLNTAGGLTGGDQLAYRVSLDAGAQLTATTQTAERAYASAGGVAEVNIAFTLEPEAHIDWLPQETILFDGSALRRTTRVELASGSTCLMAEMLTLGRAAMGETVETLDLVDRRIITRDGTPVFIDPFRLTGEDIAQTTAAGLGAATALATIILISPDAEDRLAQLRRELPQCAVASAWDGKLVVRAMSPDPYRLRRTIAALLKHLRGTDLPRVWQY